MLLGRLGQLFGYGALARMLKVLACLSVIIPAQQVQGQTVAILGDSLIAGYGLAPQDGFVSQMQDRLAQDGWGGMLLNAGVSGDTSAGGLARLDWTLGDDVDALVVLLGGNDFLRGIDPVTTRANLTALVERATDRGVPVLLMGMIAPPNFGPDYKAQFDAIYPDLAAAFDLALIPDFLGPVRQHADDPARMQQLLQGDGIHPSRAGVALIVEELAPQFSAFLAAIRS